MSKTAAAATVYGVTGAVLLLFLVWPLAESVRGAFVDPAGRPTVEYLAAVLRNPIVLEGLRNALFIAVAAAGLACLVGVSVALVLDRYDFPGKRWLAALVPLPLMVPPFVGALGIRQLLGQAGALNALLERLGMLDPAHPVDWLRRGRLWPSWRSPPSTSTRSCTSTCKRRWRA